MSARHTHLPSVIAWAPESAATCSIVTLWSRILATPRRPGGTVPDTGLRRSDILSPAPQCKPDQISPDVRQPRCPPAAPDAGSWWLIPASLCIADPCLLGNRRNSSRRTSHHPRESDGGNRARGGLQNPVKFGFSVIWSDRVDATAMRLHLLRWILDPVTSWQALRVSTASRGRTSFDVAWRRARVARHPEEAPYVWLGHRAPASTEQHDQTGNNRPHGPIGHD